VAAGSSPAPFTILFLTLLTHNFHKSLHFTVFPKSTVTGPRRLHSTTVHLLRHNLNVIRNKNTCGLPEKQIGDAR